MSRREPDPIMAESFRIIEAEVGPHSFSAREWPIVRRMIHASGDIDLARSVRFHRDPIDAAIAAIRKRNAIVTDVTMVLSGIKSAWASTLGVPLHCFLPDATAPVSAPTRCAAGIELAVMQLPGAIYVIGNAPTALQALCAAISEKRARPALILAMPVGFVAVQESKEEAMRLDVPVIGVLGRKGGSAIAAAAINALLQMALEDRP